ncbi:MAG: SHOCT domain-containing protein [Ruminococcus sp.]|nr:SHOCT domain-containing protein [Ruminococcus sp.]
MMFMIQLASNKASVGDFIITFIPLAVILTAIFIYKKNFVKINSFANKKRKKTFVPVVFFSLLILIVILVGAGAIKDNEAKIVLISIISGLTASSIIGVICEKIMESKGYPIEENNGFWWGFFLNIIGIIICAVQLPYSLSQNAINQNQYPNDKEKPYRPVEQKSESVSSQIKELKELLDCGAITEEEYNAKKKQILGI